MRSAPLLEEFRIIQWIEAVFLWTYSSLVKERVTNQLQHKRNRPRNGFLECFQSWLNGRH